MDNIQYDETGRMLYHPDIHFAHGKRMSDYELAYLCKFWEYDGRAVMSMALGKTESVLTNKYWQISRDGKLGYYRRLWDSYFEEDEK